MRKTQYRRNSLHPEKHCPHMMGTTGHLRIAIVAAISTEREREKEQQETAAELEMLRRLM